MECNANVPQGGDSGMWRVNIYAAMLCVCYA